MAKRPPSQCTLIPTPVLLSERLLSDTVKLPLITISRQERKSHPVGTTVRLTELFGRLVVRKQSALKNASTCLSHVKRILKAYALARSSVRFSLWILKSKDVKDSWTYAPAAEPSIEDATAKIIGQSCADNCLYLTIQKDGLDMQVFLPKNDAQIESISNGGHYLSVDSRPMSPDAAFSRVSSRNIQPYYARVILI